MFAIKVIPDKKKPENWFLYRDINDYVVYCWNEKKDAEEFMQKLNYDLCELTEDIPSSVIRRFNEKRDLENSEEKQ